MSYQMLYAQVLNALPQAVCHCDGQGVIGASNPAAQVLLGYDAETLHQTPWLELIHISDQALIEERWQYLHAHADASPCTVRCLCGECSGITSAYVSVRVTFTATYDAQGVLEHVLLWLTPAAHDAKDTHAANDNDSNDVAVVSGHNGDVLRSLVPAHAMSSSALPSSALPSSDSGDDSGSDSSRAIGSLSYDLEPPTLQAFDIFSNLTDPNPTSPNPTNPNPTNPNLMQPPNRHLADERVIAQDFWLDDSPAMIAVLDRQWRFVHVSDAAADLVGQTAEHILGQTLWDALPKLQHNQAGQAFRRAMTTGQPLYYEFLTEDEHFQGAWHGVRIIPFEDRLLVSVKDITEQKANEQRLIAAKHQAEVLLDQRNAILESINDYFFILNRDYRFVYANQVVLDLLGETPTSILNRTIWDTVNLPASNPFRQAYVKAINEQVPQRVRHRSSNPKLTGQFLEIALYPFFGGVIGYSRDITESENLRLKLNRALADKEAILNSITDGVSVLDRQGKYLYANQKLRQLIPDIVGKTYATLFPEHQETIFARYYQRAFDTQRPVFFEAVGAISKQWQEVRVYPDGDRITIFATDINERKRLEQDLLETNHKLQQSEAKFRAFFEDSYAAHFILNLQDPDQPIERFITNAAFDRLFAGTLLAATDRYLSLADYQVISRQLTDDYYPLLERGLQGKEHQTRANKRYLNRDGSSFWADVSSIFVRDEQGEASLVISTIVDISEQKRIQQALEISEAKFRNFFERSSVPYTLSMYQGSFEAEDGFVYLYNQAFADLVADTVFLDDLELTSLPSVNDAIERITHPDDLRQQDQLEAILAQGQRTGYQLEKRYFKRDGEVIWVNVNAQLWHDDVADVWFIIATVLDITEQKRNEQNLHAALAQLEASEAKFRAFFEASTTPLFMYVATKGSAEDRAENGQGEWLFNQAFHHFLRHTAWPEYDHDTMTLSQSAEVIKDITHPEDVALEQHFMADVLAGTSNGYRMEKRYLNKDGSIVWGDLNTVTVRDDDGHVRLTFAIVQDITQIKRTEQALKTSEAKFRAFFENNITPCTMFIFDPTDEWERGFHFNDAFADFLKDTAFADYSDRLSSVEDTLQSLSAIAHPEDNAQDERCVAEVIAGERDEYHLEKRYFARDGSILWGDIKSVFLRDDQGELTLGMSIVQDITERKRVQAALEKALTEKEILLKEVHHRTKNNMQLISSMLALQSRHIADQIAKEALVDSSKRINLLANMHRVLYQTSDGEMIDAGEQISSLLTNLTLGFRNDLTLNQDIATIYLDVHQAIPLGLIANELLTNVFKHAFPENRPEDSLTVRLWQAPAGSQADSDVPVHLRDGVDDAVSNAVDDVVNHINNHINNEININNEVNSVVTLEIIDNGVGLATEYPRDHLGMVVIEALAQQLEATFNLSNTPEGGCLAHISFRKHAPRLH